MLNQRLLIFIPKKKIHRQIKEKYSFGFGISGVLWFWAQHVTLHAFLVVTADISGENIFQP